MSTDPKLDALMELIGALFMLSGALYFQHLARLCLKMFHAQPPPHQAITAIRTLAAVIAVILAFMSLGDMKKVEKTSDVKSQSMLLK